MVSIQFIKVVGKKPEEFTGKYCHENMHKKDYRIAHSVKVSEEFAHALQARDDEAWQRAENVLRRHGMEGTFIVQINRGGPGRPPAFRLKADKRPSGIKQLGRIKIQPQKEEDEGEYFVQF